MFFLFLLPPLVRAGRLIALHGATASPTAPLRSIPDEGLRGALARLKDARDDAGSTCEHADMCRSYLAAYGCAALPAQSCGSQSVFMPARRRYAGYLDDADGAKIGEGQVQVA